MSYFKFTSPAALSAWDDLVAKTDELQNQALTFAALFGGLPVISRDLTRLRFSGISFKGPAYSSPELWTKPQQKNRYSVRPRARVPKELEKDRQALKATWDAQIPSADVSYTEFYQSIGLDWGQLFLTGRSLFRFDQAIYVSTGATPDPSAGAIEILGSAFNTARKAFDEAEADKNER